MYQHIVKRWMDIVFSLCLLAIFAIPSVLIAIGIKLDSEGPILFQTERLGKNKKPFYFYKFRTMRIDAPEDVPTRFLDSDRYITRFGSFLRKYGMDEIPQLFCILKGDMSLVGPRPAGFSERELILEREKYGVNEITPGLTGLAQVNGRDILAKDPSKKALVDGVYAKKVSFLLDMTILFQTVKVIVCREGFEEGKGGARIEREKAHEET